METAELERFVSVREVADALGVTKAGVFLLIQRGALPAVRIPNFRRVLIPVRDLESLIRSGRSAGETQ